MESETRRDHAPDAIGRREALRRLAVLMGGAATLPSVASVLAGCGEAGYAFRAMTPAQGALAGALAEHILPETDTPGAKTARVDVFIDQLLDGWYFPADRERFLAGLGDVDARAQEAHGNAFVDCTPEQQRALVAALDREAYAPPKETPPEETRPETPPAQEGADGAGDAPMPADEGGGPPDETAEPRNPARADVIPTAPGTYEPPEAPAPFFRDMKALTLAGYYTSEAGATKELKVMPMGQWRADVPYDEIDHAWA